MIFTLLLFLSITFHYKAIQVEKQSMTLEDYERQCMYERSLGPGAPCNNWMSAASLFYVLTFMSLLFYIK
jgi:hypothetical protein